ncbi:MAG: trypsin-like serine protease [Proteobacteria bacterium]|nr:trypsin-like serine protease [Pseudomonadota bacterium]
MHRHLLALAAGLVLGASALAQTASDEFVLRDYAFDSATARSEAAAGHVVRLEGAPWVRLLFKQVELAPGAKLRITSLQDGAVQHLDAASLRQWQWSSAYFNGSAVKVEVLGNAKGSRFAIGKVMVGKTGAELAAARAEAARQNDTESQCGTTDDRVPSIVRYSARLMSVGCTANLMNTGCFTTAGHCMTSASSAKVVEFNVPPSQANGNVVHPAPKDQYTLTNNRKFVQTVIGNDWGAFTTNPNSETGLTALQAQGASLTFGPSPAVGDTAQIDGYGVDSGTANQTLQVNSGPITEVNAAATRLRYRADTEGGNSGSAVLVNGQMVAIHTNAGCTRTGGANQGTLISNAAFQTAYEEVCGSEPPAGPTCADITKFGRSCKAGTLKVRVVMNDASHDGQSVMINVDGLLHDTPIVNGRAVLTLADQTAGAHTVTLAEPAECYPARTVTCD